VDEPSNIVRVPKPAHHSFNPGRPLKDNSLIENQVKHFREVEKRLPRQKKAAAEKFASIETEGQAAEFIRHITLRLHKRKARKQGA